MIFAHELWAVLVGRILARNTCLRRLESGVILFYPAGQIPFFTPPGLRPRLSWIRNFPK
jgi:hypothetical protein